jgi:integrase
MAHSSDIRKRHSRSCNSLHGGGCNCQPSYQARVWVPADGKRRTRTFSGKGAQAAAKGWVTDARKLVQDGKLRASQPTTLREAVDDFLTGAEKGAIRKRNGDEYKPAVLRQYRGALYKHVIPVFGDRRLDSITFAELERLQEHLQEKMSGGTVRNCFVPLMTIFKRAKRAGVIAVKPTDDLELPSSGTRDRAATPAQAKQAIDALSLEAQALWATAFYAGLRRGELRALKAENIHASYIDVQHGWDNVEGEQAPKSKAGVRRVPYTEALRAYLGPHLERTGRTGQDLVFGKTATVPFLPRDNADVADTAWEEAKLPRWMLQEARHSFRTWLDASPISETRARRYHGHADAHVSGRYIHPPDSQLVDDAARLDAYLEGAIAGKIVPISGGTLAEAPAAAIPVAGAGNG